MEEPESKKYENLEYISDWERAYGIPDDLLSEYRRHTDNLRRFEIWPSVNVVELEGLAQAEDGLARLKSAQFDPTAQTGLFETARVDFIHSTAALEGIGLSVEDVELILSEDLVVPKYSMRSHLEITDINEAFDAMVGFVKTGRELDVGLILEIHSIASRHLPDCEPGALRWDQRYVSNRVIPPPPKHVERLLVQAVNWYKKDPGIPRAAGFHCLFEDIHPFQDGNGRTGRILLNYMLMRLGYPVVSLKSDREHALQYHGAIRQFIEDLGFRDATAFAQLVVDAVNASTAREINRLEQVKTRTAGLSNRIACAYPSPTDLVGSGNLESAPDDIRFYWNSPELSVEIEKRFGENWHAEAKIGATTKGNWGKTLEEAYLNNYELVREEFKMRGTPVPEIAGIDCDSPLPQIGLQLKDSFEEAVKLINRREANSERKSQDDPDSGPGASAFSRNDPPRTGGGSR